MFVPFISEVHGEVAFDVLIAVVKFGRLMMGRCQSEVFCVVFWRALGNSRRMSRRPTAFAVLFFTASHQQCFQRSDWDIDVIETPAGNWTAPTASRQLRKYVRTHISRTLI